MDTDRFVGTDVAGYAIESVLGRGAMGVVYVARQRSPERRVALKLITPAFADDEVFRRRFLREATAAAAIEHPTHPARVRRGRVRRHPVHGDASGRRAGPAGDPAGVDRSSRSIGSCGSSGRSVSALDAAHARGLVHRDVKPGNVLVTQQPDAEDADFCYLTDFGVSTWTASSASDDHADGPDGRDGELRGARADRRGSASMDAPTCTRWGACCTSASRAGRRSAVGARRRSCTPTSTRRRRPPSLDPPRLAAGVDEVMGRALRKAPEERYASCRELTQDLRAALAGPSPTPARIPLAAAPSQGRHLPIAWAGDTGRGSGRRGDLARGGRWDRVPQPARSGHGAERLAVGRDAAPADPGGRTGDREPARRRLRPTPRGTRSRTCRRT